MIALTRDDIKTITSAIVKEIQKKYFLVRKAVFDSDSIPLQLRILQAGMHFVSEKHAIKVEHLCSSARTRDVAEARMRFCFLISRHFPEISLHKIGQSVNVTHATVIYAKKTIQDRMDVDKREMEIMSTYLLEFPAYIQNWVKTNTQ